MMNEQALERFAELMIGKIKEVEISDWKKPWFTGTATGVPQNLGGRPYSNQNKWLLYALMDMCGYRTPVFLTFNQAKQEGLMIAKGSKAFPVVFYDMYVKHRDTGERIDYARYKLLPLEEQARYKVVPIQKSYPVFNLDQTDYAEKYPDKWGQLQARFAAPSSFEGGDTYRHPSLDYAIRENHWICPIELQYQDRAFFRPSENKIVLPLPGQFRDSKEFYMTALHEMAHSTGPGLERKSGFFGTPDYAREELVAEFSSAVVAKDLGLFMYPRKENAAYLKSWLSVLSDNPKEIVSILGDVGKACQIMETTLEANYEKGLSTGKGRQLPDSTDILAGLQTAGIKREQISSEQWEKLLRGKVTTLGTTGQSFILAKSPAGSVVKPVEMGKHIVKDCTVEL